ncbi:MAG: PRC-barrel domain-containing protein [Patescibacteria group bacterium]
MPFITSKQLIGLPVETESGTILGKILDFEVDAETQSILRYTVVNRSNVIFKSELLIAAAAVLALTREKMTVRDGLVKEIASSKKERMITPKIEPSGVAMRKQA